MVALSRGLRRSRFLALVLAVLTAVGTTGSWHVEGDDPDCAAPVAHDHAAHHERIDRQTATTAPSHCAICHWLQGFRAPAVRQARVYLAAGESTSLTHSLADAIRSVDRVAQPSRAPPA